MGGRRGGLERVLLGILAGVTGCDRSAEVGGAALSLDDWALRRSPGQEDLGRVDLTVEGTLDGEPWCCWFSGTDPGGDATAWVVLPVSHLPADPDHPAVFGWSGPRCADGAIWRLTDGTVAVAGERLEVMVEVRDLRSDELLGVIDETVR